MFYVLFMFFIHKGHILNIIHGTRPTNQITTSKLCPCLALFAACRNHSLRSELWVLANKLMPFPSSPIQVLLFNKIARPSHPIDGGPPLPAPWFGDLSTGLAYWGGVGDTHKPNYHKQALSLPRPLCCMLKPKKQITYPMGQKTPK